MTKWVDRALVVSPYYIGLCRTEKKFQRELKAMNIAEKDWPRFVGIGANARTHFFEKSDGKLCAIVCMPKAKGCNLIQHHALLVHEAVHIWQEIKKAIGERSPSCEFEAYSIQSISQGLMEAWK